MNDYSDAIVYQVMVVAYISVIVTILIATSDLLFVCYPESKILLKNMNSILIVMFQKVVNSITHQIGMTLFLE